MQTAAVIGAGLGGLALGIRLQSAGVATTIIEARDRPGGQVRGWERDGFTFEGGPAALTDSQAFAELWRLSGRDIAEDIELLTVEPLCRLLWPDGTRLDISADDAALTRQIADLNPEDVAGYRRFLDHAGALQALGQGRAIGETGLDWGAMLREAPQYLRNQGWRSLYGLAAACVGNEHLREALSFPALLIGGNPMAAGAAHAVMVKQARDGGGRFPRGGMAALARAMAAHFERLGGLIRYGDAAVAIETLGDRATGVTTASGRHSPFDAVASDADAMQTYAKLLAHSKRGERAARALERKRFSPSLFVVHFGIRGAFPGIPHHMALFGPRYRGLLTDIFEHGVLARDFWLSLRHPSVTDPALAPEGCSVFTAVAPVPNRGKLPIDWGEVGPIYADRILDHLEARLLPSLRERLVTRFHVTPADFEAELRLWKGAAFSLEPRLAQSGRLRVRNRDDRIPNLYFVGAGTPQGAGALGVVESAKVTAALMLDDLRRAS